MSLPKISSRKLQYNSMMKSNTERQSQELKVPFNSLNNVQFPSLVRDVSIEPAEKDPTQPDMKKINLISSQETDDYSKISTYNSSQIMTKQLITEDFISPQRSVFKICKLSLNPIRNQSHSDLRIINNEQGETISPQRRVRQSNFRFKTRIIEPQQIQSDYNNINQAVSQQFIEERKLKEIKTNQIEYDEDEHNIWGEDSDDPLPINLDNQNKLILFFELLKYRFEKNDSQTISCYDVIRLAQQLVKRHPKCYMKWFGNRKVQWLDFRDWTKNVNDEVQ